jgi:peptide/nickel transport system substrate-binding protein
MRRKHVLSLFMLSMGVALLVAATTVGVASAKSQHASAKKGGKLIVTQAGTAFDTLDPQLAYVTNDWWVLDATQLLLVNFPDKSGKAGTQLFPEAAKSLPTVSKNGKTYTFHLRSGLRFSDGSKVTAAAFQRAFERVLSPQMFAQYGTFDQIDQWLVGGQKFAKTGAFSNEKSAPKHISGIKAKGLTLTIHLTKPVPQFTSVMAMQWFGAVKPSMPYAGGAHGKSKEEVYPSAGPYHIVSNNLTSLTVLKRNKFWAKEKIPGKRPANASQIIIHSYPQSNGEAQMLQAEKGQVDIAGVPPADRSKIGKKYGVNRKHGQFHVGTTSCIDWFELNNGKGPMQSVAARKAVNFALGRNEFLVLSGKYSGSAADQLLVPGIPGYKKFNVYPAVPNVAKAKSVGGKSLKGNMNVWYLPNDPFMNPAAQYIQHQLQTLGFKATLQQANPDDYYDGLETKATAEGPNGYDIAWGGWCADYFDPFDYFNVNLDGRTIGATGNVDYFYFNNPSFIKSMDKAAAKSGKARASSYASLDKQLMTKYVPFVPYEDGNNIYLTSHRTGNWIYSNYFGGPFLNALTVG